MPVTQHNDRSAAMTYLVYDRKNGRVLARYRQYSLPADRYCECDENAILKLFQDDPAVVGRVSDGDPKNLAVHPIHADDRENRALRVSTKRGTVEPLPRLRMRSDRDVLQGDGKDSVLIQVDVVDENGTIMRDFKGKLVATTSRGKLSASGGNVLLKNGQATFSLTSTTETANRVQLRIHDPKGLALPSHMNFRFE